MSRRFVSALSFSTVGLLLVCATSLFSGSAVAKSLDPSKPNFVLILIDDMAWAGTSVQMDPNNPDSKSDYHQTPNLEMLASQGMVFSDFYAPGPMCSPSRVAMQTGKSPAALHTTDVRQSRLVGNDRFKEYYTGVPLTPPQARGSFEQETSIGAMLKQIDPSYNTAWHGKWDWDPRPTLTGYDEANDNSLRVNPPAEDPAGIFSLTQLATDFLDRNDQTEDPFFLQISHDAVKSIEAKQSTIDYFEGLPPGEKHRSAVYAAMHKDLDDSIGVVLDRLDTMGIVDNTYVIFTADHGAPIGFQNAELWNAPLYGGKGTIWEGALRVPMIVRGPGIQPSSNSDVPVIGTDIWPTIRDLAGGGTAPEGIEGTSMAPVLFNSGNLPAKTDSLSRLHAPNGELYFHFPHYGPTLPTGTPTPASAIRDGHYKLVRVFGERGAPDDLLLFDLSASLEESSDPNSPLNLASSMPDKVAELSAKLDNWFQSVDASLPYTVSDPVRMDWKASQPGQESNQWRSVQDVDFYDREVFSDVGSPETQAVQAFQPGLKNAAFELSSSEGFVRRFLHVSDSKNPDLFDADHSASLEFWLRFDSLTGEQLILEAGSQNQGISLSLGDADGDTVANDLRFRVVGLDGQHLTVTAPIDQFNDPTTDFVHVAAVINDSELDRYIELYVNGKSVGRADGVPGSNEINWDSFSRMFVGVLPPTVAEIGASSGEGDLPFIQGSFAGQLSAFRFENYAVSAEQVLNSYNSELDPVQFGIHSLTGDASRIANRPSSVASGELESSKRAVVMLERQDTLGTNLDVDFLSTTTMPGTLEAGAAIASYLVHFDPLGTPTTAESATGSITFDNEILAIISTESSLFTSDALLGSIGEYETISRQGDFLSGDFFLITPDRKTLSFQLSAIDAGIAQLRVITEAGLVGDFNGDATVDMADYSMWRQDLGPTITQLAADGNGDGRVDDSDFQVWRDNYGQTAELPGDYNADGDVNLADYAIWRNLRGSTGVDLSADGNGDGVVDASDYELWQDNVGIDFSDLAIPGDYNSDGSVDLADYSVWRNDFGSRISRISSDVNRDGIVDEADYLLWNDNYGNVLDKAPEPSGLPGDFNYDGVVDLADYSVWRNSFGATGNGLRADGNGDGTVDAADYDFWKKRVGDTLLTSGSNNAAVPEPSTCVLMLLFGLLAVRLSSARR